MSTNRVQKNEIGKTLWWLTGAPQRMQCGSFSNKLDITKKYEWNYISYPRACTYTFFLNIIWILLPNYVSILSN